jgi:trehalose/maltose hydrolase-like predicted phosphorylase
MTGIISPDPITDWLPAHLPAYLSNGLIGMRVGTVPWARGVTTINGFEGMDTTLDVEAIAQAPYVLGGDLTIGRVRLSESPQRATPREIRYDFSCGELHASFRFEADDARADVTLVSFCSRTRPSLVLQEAVVVVDRDCDMAHAATIDTRDIPGSWVNREAHPSAVLAATVDGMLRWGSHGGLSTCGIAYLTELSPWEGATREFSHDRIGPLTTTYTARARAGVRYRLRRMVSLVPQTTHNEPHIHAIRLLQQGQRIGFDQLREDNRARWAELWKSRVVLSGAPKRWQAIADAAFFYLHTSTHASAPSSSAVFGLAYWPNYHYYRGHLMWDMETFAVPTLTLTNPPSARGILTFRSTRVMGARANAAAAGLEGLQYPWESSMRYGQEAAPVDAATAGFEHHVSMDVAIAFARYVLATGDRDFAAERAWPVMAGVAEWICSRVDRTPRGYEIRKVIGVAETESTVDNNAFVNMGAIMTLRYATALGRMLGRGNPEAWDRLASAIVLPTDQDRGVILNHDGHQPDEKGGETPEAPAGLFLLGYDTDPDTLRRTMEYYLKTAYRYAGQPMLSSMLGLIATQLGDRGAALDLFERGYADFVVDPFRITTEFSPTVYPERTIAGPFTANLAGFLTACIYGLTGMRIGRGEPGSWCGRPVVLPQGWDGVHVERLWVRGRTASLTAEHGADSAHLAVDSTPSGTI